MKAMKKTLAPIYIDPDVLKEIFLRLPLKSLVKFKLVSKKWRSIFESKSFIDMHLSFQKHVKNRRKIMAGYKCDCCDRPSLSPVSEFQGDEEIVYLHCDTARSSMSCDGLVCIPEPGWVNVLNLSTGELRRFPSGPDPVPEYFFPPHRYQKDPWYTFFPGFWVMGFGRDKVTGRYKVVRMCFDPVECDVLDFETGEWRKLRSAPCYEVMSGMRSACVNGSLYWLNPDYFHGYRILGLDLPTEEFRDVESILVPHAFARSAQILNLDDSLAIATTKLKDKILEIWCMNSKQGTWTNTYSINLADVAMGHPYGVWWFTPVAITKEGNVLISDQDKFLFKYYPHSNVTRPLSPSTCCVKSPYLENLVRLNI